MKFLIITQVYWPDTASTAQHLTDIAEYLTSQQHEVTVISGRHAYENPSIKYRPAEQRNGVNIKRIKSTSFGKKNIAGRLMDFFTFNCSLVFKLAGLKKKEADVMIGMTSPPLVSFFGVWFAKRKGMDFHYWTMDLQPELSIASGLMKEGALPTRLLTSMGNYIFRNSDNIIALDKYMCNHIVNRGASQNAVSVIPVWPVMDSVYDGARRENPFRIQNNFGNKIVVMYSGNHSFVHPLDTVLDAALHLSEDPRFLFVFIGEGVRKKDVTKFREKNNLDSIVQLPYQPREVIHLSLGSADLQVVILGENQVGYTHPNKVYGAMFIGKPILYVGPKQSHIGDILQSCPGNIFVQTGEGKLLAEKLQHFADRGEQSWLDTGMRNQQYAHQHFHPDTLKAKMAETLSLS